MIFYDYLLTPQLFSYTAISRRNTVSCIKYQYRAALPVISKSQARVYSVPPGLCMSIIFL